MTFYVLSRFCNGYQKRTFSHMTKENKERWINKAGNALLCLKLIDCRRYKQLNCRRAGATNFLSGGIFESLNWNGAQSFGKRHPANPHVLREDEFSSDLSNKIGWLQQNNFVGILTLILYNRSGAGFYPTCNLVFTSARNLTLANKHWQPPWCDSETTSAVRCPLILFLSPF